MPVRGVAVVRAQVVVVVVTEVIIAATANKVFDVAGGVADGENVESAGLYAAFVEEVAGCWVEESAGGRVDEGDGSDEELYVAAELYRGILETREGRTRATRTTRKVRAKREPIVVRGCEVETKHHNHRPASRCVLAIR